MNRKDQAKRVVFSTDNLFGGTGAHLLHMTKYWDPSQWMPIFISKARKTVHTSFDVPIEFLPSPRLLTRYPFAQLHEIRYFNRYLSAKSPDIVHAYFFWPILYGRIMKILGKINILVENREDQGFDWGRHEYALLNWTRSLPDRVICVSDAVREEVLRKEHLDPNRTMVIRNGVEIANGDKGDKSVIRRDLGLGEDDLVVGIVANYDRPIKGVSHFLESIPFIVREVPSARFLVLGKGGEEERPMRKKAKSLGIDPFVIFAGYQEDIHRYYSIMDISALTSLSEGLSITILESMGHGIPVVATNVGGNPEVVVDGETGYLVPPGNIPSFVEKVVHLLKHPDLRFHMGQAGCRKVETQFRICDVAKKYLGVYEELIDTA